MTVRQQIYGEDKEHLRFDQMLENTSPKSIRKSGLLKIKQSSKSKEKGESSPSFEEKEVKEEKRPKKITMNRLSLHSLVNEYDM